MNFIVDLSTETYYISNRVSWKFLDNQNIVFAELAELYWIVVFFIDQWSKTCVLLSMNEYYFCGKYFSQSLYDEKVSAFGILMSI